MLAALTNATLFAPWTLTVLLDDSDRLRAEPGRAVFKETDPFLGTEDDKG